MKKAFVLITALICIISFAGIVSLAGCKEEQAESNAVEEEAMGEEEAIVEEDEGEEDEGEVVAADEELYINVSGGWSHAPWQQAKVGCQMADEFWGDELTVEFAGPPDYNSDEMLAALEASIARKPTGIIWLSFGVGEDELLTQYHADGGMIMDWVGVTGNYPSDIMVGVDNRLFGQDLAKWMIDVMSEKQGVAKEDVSFKIGLMTLVGNALHLTRLDGIMDVLSEYPGVEIVGPTIDEGGDAETAAKNASAFIAQNPDVDCYIGTAALTGGALGRALKEAGYAPGEKVVIGADQDPELIVALQEGYLHGSLGYSFAAEMFHGITAMHIAHDALVKYTNNDKEYGFTVLPQRIITPVYRITGDIAEAMDDMPSPK